MDLATIIGFAGGTVLVVIVMQMSGSLLMYWDLISLIVVLGGSLFSVLARYPLPIFIRSLPSASKAFSNPPEDPETLMNEILELAQIARKQSILALEKVDVKNKYLARAVKFMVDGYDPKIINDVIFNDMVNLKERHKNGINIMNDMAEGCPAFGMIGTVIGLIVIMANLSDPSKIGPGLAVALVTTLYGSLFANMFFLPLQKKLEYRSKEEVANMSIIIEGVNAILNGENPRTIQERLESYVGPIQPV